MKRISRKKLVVFSLRFINKLRKDRIRAHAAEAAFFTIMTIFPILMLILNLIHLTPITSDQIIYVLEQASPVVVTNMIKPWLNSVYRQNNWTILWMVLVALFTAGKCVIGLNDGLNAIHRTDDRSDYITLRLKASFYALFLILAVVVALVIMVFGYHFRSVMVAMIPDFVNYHGSLPILTTVIANIILVLLFAFMYAYMPKKHHAFIKQLPGAIFAAVTWSIFTYGFSKYLSIATNMTLLYGSLSTLIMIMFWFYCLMYLLLLGAEINHYFAHPEYFSLD